MMDKGNCSEDFRRECEARTIMKRTHDQRIAYYTAIRRIRGPQAADELITEVKRQYRLSQEKSMER